MQEMAGARGAPPLGSALTLHPPSYPSKGKPQHLHQAKCGWRGHDTLQPGQQGTPSFLLHPRHDPLDLRQVPRSSGPSRDAQQRGNLFPLWLHPLTSLASTCPKVKEEGEH